MKKDNIKLVGAALIAGIFMSVCSGCSTANGGDNTEAADNTDNPVSTLGVVTPDNEGNVLLYSVNSDNTTITITGFQEISGKLYIPETIDSYTVTDIGDYAFFKTDVVEVSFPKTIIKIGEAAFYGCPKLKTVSFAENDTPLVTISNYSFANCDNLESVVIPIPTTVISNYAFTNCSNLSNVVIDETAILKEAAFWGCPSSPVEYEEHTANIITVNVPDGYEYSDWTTVDSMTSETPIQTTQNDTRRVLSNGYTITSSEKGYKIVYKYIIQERQRTEKMTEKKITTYNYGIFAEEDGKVDVKWCYNQPDIPNGAFPLSKADAELEELVKELEEKYEKGELLIQ